jgi:hypothetical protein
VKDIPVTFIFSTGESRGVMWADKRFYKMHPDSNSRHYVFEVEGVYGVLNKTST